METLSSLKEEPKRSKKIFFSAQQVMGTNTQQQTRSSFSQLGYSYPLKLEERDEQELCNGREAKNMWRKTWFRW